MIIRMLINVKYKSINNISAYFSFSGSRSVTLLVPPRNSLAASHAVHGQTCSHPRPVFSAHPLQVVLSPQVSADRGSALSLTCNASGCLHPPSVTWRRTDQNRTVLQRTRQKDGVSLLHLQDLDLQDQGGYSCEAECDSVIRTRDIQVHVYCESYKIM